MTVNGKNIRLKHRLEYAALKASCLILGLLPFSLVEKLGTALGTFVWIFFPIRLPTVYTNLTRMFPEKNRTEKMRLARRVYQHHGYILTTYLSFSRKKMVQKIIRADVRGQSILKKALLEGKGVILTSIHFGPWEACGAWFNINGYPLSVIYRTQKNPLTNRYFIDQRLQFGENVRLIDRNQTSRFVKELRENRFLTIAMDQKAGIKRGTPVSFLNRKTYLPKGAAFFHLRTKAPVLWVISKMLNGRISVEIGRFDFPEYRGVSEHNINQITAAVMSRFESVIRENPEQWFWFHKLWPRRYPDKCARTLREILFTV